MLEKKVVDLNDFKQSRTRMESTNLCRFTLERTMYIYNNEMFSESLLLKLLKNAAGLLEKKLKIDEMNKCPELPDSLTKELSAYESEISHLANEINKILDNLVECQLNHE